MTAVGRSVRRVEDARLLRGAGRFVDDVDRPGQLWLRIVRASSAHASLTGVDRDRARCRRVDAAQLGVRARAADDAHPQLAGAVDVVDEAPGAAQQAAVLDAPHRAADRAHRVGDPSSSDAEADAAAASAAARTASRIDW